MAVTLTCKNVRIRKERQCYSCYRKFPVGTEMNYWTGIYVGEFNSVYSCLTCVAIMNMDTENEFPEGYVYECLDKDQTPEEYLNEIKQIQRQ